MKKWRVELRVSATDEEDFVTSLSTEFERDTRDGALGFALSEVARLIERIARPDVPE